MSSTPSPVWFITGASSGFGKAIALEALRRGHKVIASARSTSNLADLQAAGAAVLDLDVTADEATIAAKVAEANAIYGIITHVISAAGYVLDGAVEETSQQEIHSQFNTNVFGTINITRATTPYLRTASSTGHQTALATFGSLGSWTGFAATAVYCATKAAVSLLTEGVAKELRPFGISVCVVEPGYTRTEFLVREASDGRQRRVQAGRRLSVYDGTAVREAQELLERFNLRQAGDVERCAVAIVDTLTRSGMARGREVPVRLVTGTDTLEVVRGKCAETMRLLDEWEDVSGSTMHDE